MKVFLVEDEWIHAEDIRISIERLGHHWLGWSSEGIDAMAKIRQLQPDVVLVDIVLHGASSGLTLASYLNDELKLPFIFVTSMLEDGIIETGLQTQPVAYLTKPVQEGDLKAALLRAAILRNNDPHAEKDLEINATQLLIRVGRNLNIVNKDDILFIQSAEKNYCKIVTRKQQPFVVKKSLTALLALLPSAEFYRVHREYIIHLKAITRIDEADQMVYIDKEPVPIGFTYKPGLLKYFDIL